MFLSRIRLLYVIISAVSILFQSCSEKNASRKKKIIEIPVVELSNKDTILQKKYVASIEALRNVELRNKVAGYLEKIYVDEGQAVKKGQLLFAINKDEYQTEVSKAQAVLSNAIAEAKEAEVLMSRVKLLVDKNVISPSELEVSKAQKNARQAKINEAQSTLTNARTRLSYTYLRAPFDGIINRIPFKAGSLLSEGSLLTTVSDISFVYAYFNISEDEYLKYFRDKLRKENNRSNQVQLNLADASRYMYTGEIETMSGEFDQGTGSIALRARFPNPNKILRHGASGELILSTKADDVILVPQRSVFEIQDKNYVFAVDKNNTLKMKSFLTKTRIADFYIVQSGLQPGEKIVFEGTQNLKEGMQIIPKPVDMMSLMEKQ